MYVDLPEGWEFVTQATHKHTGEVVKITNDMKAVYNYLHSKFWEHDYAYCGGHTDEVEFYCTWDEVFDRVCPCSNKKRANIIKSLKRLQLIGVRSKAKFVWRYDDEDNLWTFSNPYLK